MKPTEPRAARADWGSQWRGRRGIVSAESGSALDKRS